MLAKTKFSTIEILISWNLINLCISQDEFVLVNTVIRQYNDMKEAIKNLKTSTAHQRF